MSKTLENILITSDASILDAMNRIDINSKGILLVVDENNRLIGTVTDGDVRRAILLGNKLSCDIKKIYNRDFIYSSDNIDFNKAKRVFIEKKIKFLPIVDKHMQVIDYLEIDDLIDYNKIEKENPILIMAGGLGTRLRPLTDDLPKPMLKIGGKPILETIIEQFKNNGFRNILISVNYKSNIIENYFGDGSNFDVSIRYIKEDSRLGTAGAIKLAEKYLKKAFFVINGDILTNLNFTNIFNYHMENKYKMTIGSRLYETQVPYGVLKTDNDCVTSLEEKPIVNYLVSGGIYVLNPEVIMSIPQNKYFDITQLIDILISKKEKVGNFPIKDYWMDIGRIEDYYKANNDIEKYF